MECTAFKYILDFATWFAALPMVRTKGLRSAPRYDLTSGLHIGFVCLGCICD